MSWVQDLGLPSQLLAASPQSPDSPHCPMGQGRVGQGRVCYMHMLSSWGDTGGRKAQCTQGSGGAKVWGAGKHQIPVGSEDW